MHHMKTASVRDLRYHFPQIEARLREGEAIDITKRKRVIARLVPVKPRPRRRSAPDFLAMLKEIYGEHVLKVSGAELVAEQRGRY
jgi:antitoxin (DNA-binding transcriptional repressor) of toxin-antitoxin stability system